MAKKKYRLPPSCKNLALIAGKNLRRLIEQSSCKTQEEFAFRFGTDVRTVGRWVNRGINSLVTLQQIALFFEVDPLVFFDETKL